MASRPASPEPERCCCGRIRLMRRGLAWLVAVPLMLAGSQVAHVLAYRIVYPQASIRVHDLVETGHGYMSALPLALGVAGAVVVLSLAASGRRCGARARRAIASAVGVRAASGRRLRLQEYIERWLAWGFFPWYAAAAADVRARDRAPDPVRRARLPRGAVPAAHRQAPRAPPRSLSPPRLATSAPPLLVPAAQPLPPLPSLLSRRLGRRGPPLLVG